MERITAIVVHGNVDLSGGLIRELLFRNCPIIWCSSRGRVVGWAASAASPNGGPRGLQAVASNLGHLGIAREIVSAKVASQATLLRRRGNDAPSVASLRVLSRSALAAPSIEQLLGIEGDAAARYFRCFEGMITRAARESGLVFEGRSRRPARDPINACLNFVYGLLVADSIRAILSCGLDPHQGFLHSSGRNKPALALDLAEEFRAPLAEATVVGAVNNGEIKRHDLSDQLGSFLLRDAGRKALITSYERRLLIEFKHPLFGYTISWRRAIEVQARLLLGVLDGSMPRYVGIRTR